MARCEDWPCCGHTDGLPCDWTPPSLDSDPHALCDHEDGICELYPHAGADDLDDDEDEGYDDPFADVPQDTPLALEG